MKYFFYENCDINPFQVSIHLNYCRQGNLFYGKLKLNKSKTNDRFPTDQKSKLEVISFDLTFFIYLIKLFPNAVPVAPHA